MSTPKLECCRALSVRSGDALMRSITAASVKHLIRGRRPHPGRGVGASTPAPYQLLRDLRVVRGYRWAGVLSCASHGKGGLVDGEIDQVQQDGWTSPHPQATPSPPARPPAHLPPAPPHPATTPPRSRPATPPPCSRSATPLPPGRQCAIDDHHHRGASACVHCAATATPPPRPEHHNPPALLPASHRLALLPASYPLAPPPPRHSPAFRRQCALNEHHHRGACR